MECYTSQVQKVGLGWTNASFHLSALCVLVDINRVGYYWVSIHDFQSSIPCIPYWLGWTSLTHVILFFMLSKALPEPEYYILLLVSHNIMLFIYFIFWQQVWILSMSVLPSFMTYSFNCNHFCINWCKMYKLVMFVNFFKRWSSTFVMIIILHCSHNQLYVYFVSTVWKLLFIESLFHTLSLFSRPVTMQIIQTQYGWVRNVK